MQLLGSVASPFVQRCAIVARTKGLDIDVLPVPGGAIHSPEFQALAPMGRIPLLAFDDGTYLCESGAIAGYLDEVLDGPSLMPADPRARAHVRAITDIAVGEVAAGLRPVMVHRVFRVSENEPVVEAGIAQTDKGWSALARLMGDTPYAAGDALTLADAALTPFVALIDIIAHVPEIAALIERHPLLSAYRERAQRDPVLVRTPAEMSAAFAAIAARINAPAEA